MRTFSILIAILFGGLIYQAANKRPEQTVEIRHVRGDRNADLSGHGNAMDSRKLDPKLVQQKPPIPVVPVSKPEREPVATPIRSQFPLADNNRPIRTISRHEVHNVFFGEGSVFGGRSASRANSGRTTPRRAPRIQGNPFAK